MLIFCLFHLYYVYAPRLQLSWRLYQGLVVRSQARGWKRPPRDPHQRQEKTAGRSRRASNPSGAPSTRPWPHANRAKGESGPPRALAGEVPTARQLWRGGGQGGWQGGRHPSYPELLSPKSFRLLGQRLLLLLDASPSPRA